MQILSKKVRKILISRFKMISCFINSKDDMILQNSED